MRKVEEALEERWRVESRGWDGEGVEKGGNGEGKRVDVGGG